MLDQTSLSQNSCRPDPLILVSEISHRVVNEYSQAVAGIRLAAAGVASCEAREILASAVTRLLRFAEAHRALQAPVSSEDIDLADHLLRLCASLSASSLQERGVRLSLSSDAILLNSQRCWRVGLIVSELITNSVRHGLRGGPGQVSVDIADAADAVVCEVADDGRAEATAHPGRGLSVVKGLAAELDGEVLWQFGAAGTTARLTFPKQSERLGA